MRWGGVGLIGCTEVKLARDTLEALKRGCRLRAGLELRTQAVVKSGETVPEGGGVKKGKASRI